jgi:hypothetical protein
VQDSSHAHGSERRGRKIGAIGDISTSSFQSRKLMTAGEGGIILQTMMNWSAGRVPSTIAGGCRESGFIPTFFMDPITGLANGRERS